MFPLIEVGIAVLGALVAILVLLVSYAGLSRVQEARFRKHARVCFDSGDICRSLQSAAKAHLWWAFNITNGSRASHVTDLERLEGIVRQISDSLSALGVENAGDGVLRTTALMREFFADDGNFRWDNRSMRWDAARRWAALILALKRERLLLRRVCKAALDGPQVCERS